MTRSRIPTQAELDTALWLDGHAAIKVAEAAHGAPGWPPLLQLLAGGGRREVPLADAQADRERGWPEFIAPARRWSEGDGFPQDGRLPDLDDPATLGCLLALVREDWNDPHIYVRKSVTRNQWVAWRKRLRDDDDEVKVSEGRTEDESLVAALEAAPRREAAPC